MSLVDDIRSGNSDAIKQLYQENAQDVYDFAKGITNNHDTAMQATKNTLSKLVQQIQAGSEPANLHSEALKLAYDEACKIAMPSVQNIKSPYDDTEETPVKETRAPQKAPRRQEQYEDNYEEDYGRQQQRRAQSRGNRPEYSRQQAPQRRSRDDYYDDYDRYDRYDDRYDDYDDYDDYEEKRGHGAGFYICLVINIILVFLLIWFLIGLLVNLGILPDSLNMLGYGWFNETIYPLF